MKINFHYVLLAFCFLILMFTNPRNTFCQESDIIFSASWGDKEGEVGLLKKPEFEVCGPLSFCIDGEDIFLADSVHGKILKIDSRKKITEIGRNISCWTLCGDGKGGVFVNEDNRIIHFNGSPGEDNEDRSSKLIHTIKDKRNARIKLIEGYGNELLVNNQGGIYLHTVNQKNFHIPGAKNDRRSLNDNIQNLQYHIKRMPGNKVRLLGFDEEGKILVSIPIIVDGGRAGAVLFKGKDLNGNLYVEVENLKPEHVDLEVHSYSHEGKLQALFILPNEYFSTVYKKTEIAPDGSVYQLLTTSEGVRILHYKKGENNGSK